MASQRLSKASGGVDTTCLLAKDPNERPESASDVLTALESIDLAPSADGASATVEDANVLDSLAGGVFVGRQAEMGQLKAGLEDVLSGRGRMVMLVGEPGIGKTRTAQELATYAGLRGCQVLWGRCHESRGAPPYWPWIQVIRSYAREHEPQQISAEMGSGAADIAEIVSDVRERLPGLQPAAKLEDPEQARFRLFDSITAFLKSASSSKPMVVILDNLHWADKPTLLLLEFLAPELANSRLMIIGTYRDVDLSRQHPLSETLGELTRERLFERVLLRGLSRQDVDRFIEMVSGITPPRGLVQAVYTQTEGNPLFVTEVVRLLVQEGELGRDTAVDRDSWEVRIPEGVREVIGRRLNRLSERCNETLTMASVIGREFEMRQLEKLVDDISSDRLLDALEEGLSARVIEETPDSVGVYQFTHALIQQTLFNEVTTTRRVRLHARIIEVLEELYSNDIDSHAIDLAYHATEAEAMIGSEKVVRYSLIAGSRALSTYAWEDAAQQFGRALLAKNGDDIVDDESVEARFGLGRAQAALLPEAQIQTAIDNLSIAFDYYVEIGELSEAVKVAEYPVLTISGFTDMAQLIGRALNLVPADSREAGRLLSRYIRALGAEQGDYPGAQDAASRAIEIARSNSDVALEMRILTELATVESYHNEWHRALDTSLQAIKLAQKVEEPRSECLAHQWAGMAHYFLGYPDEARRHVQASYELAERIRDKPRVGTSSFFIGLAAQSKGEWQEARSWIDRSLNAAPGLIYALTFRASLEYETGNPSEGEMYLERALESMRMSPKGPNWANAFPALALPLLWHVTGVANQIEAAREAAGTVLSYPNAPPMAVIFASTGLAIVAVEELDIDEASSQYEILMDWHGVYPLCYASDRVLGLLAQTMGNLDTSAGHFEDALAFCRKAGYRPELAWSLSDYADMLLERKEDGDSEKAVAMLDESLSISTELGMRPLMERVLSRREILKA